MGPPYNNDAEFPCVDSLKLSVNYKNNEQRYDGMVIYNQKHFSYYLTITLFVENFT